MTGPRWRSSRRGRATSSESGPLDAGLSWHLVLDREARSGAENMALDHALAEALPAGEAVLRLYRWSPPAVSFGRNESARGCYDAGLAASMGLGLVRRPTGGRAVLHDREVTYAAVLPVRALGGARNAYRLLGGALVEGLQLLGVPAEVSLEGVVVAPDAGPCFQAAAPGEVVSAGRKLVGSAQVRLGGSLLQHGSVILAGDQSALTRLRGEKGGEVPTATVEEALGRPVGWDEAADALAEGFRVALGGAWRKRGYRSLEIQRADRLREGRYATEVWTWRR